MFNKHFSSQMNRMETNINFKLLDMQIEKVVIVQE
jgi:hypothetical protein